MNEDKFGRILVACNSRGRMLDLCLQLPEIQSRLWGVISDHESASLDVAKRHGLAQIIAEDDSPSATLSDNILSICDLRGVDYIISTGFTRIFKGSLVEQYRGRIINTHFSILPAFPGKKGSDWTTERHPPKAIFERALTYGARVVGNTIHLVDSSIDGGYPIMQSSMPVPYDEPAEETRHRLFLQECRMFMQTVMWLSAGRLISADGQAPRIEGARFDSPTYSPAIQEPWIEAFAPPRQ